MDPWSNTEVQPFLNCDRWKKMELCGMGFTWIYGVYFTKMGFWLASTWPRSCCKQDSGHCWKSLTMFTWPLHDNEGEHASYLNSNVYITYEMNTRHLTPVNHYVTWYVHWKGGFINPFGLPYKDHEELHCVWMAIAYHLESMLCTGKVPIVWISTFDVRGHINSWQRALKQIN